MGRFLFGCSLSPLVSLTSQAFASEGDAVAPRAGAYSVNKPNAWCIRANFYVNNGNGTVTHVVGDWHCWTYTTVKSKMVSGEVTDPVIIDILANKVDQTVTLTLQANAVGYSSLLVDKDGYVAPEQGFSGSCGVSKVMVRAGEYKIVGNKVVIKAVIQ